MILTALLVVALARIGSGRIVSAMNENTRQADLLMDFRDALVRYANSNGTDDAELRFLLASSPAVERALGTDNIVSGVAAGMFMLNNVGILPIGLQLMRTEYETSFSSRDTGTQIAKAIDHVLLRNHGRRLDRAQQQEKRMSDFGACTAVGWQTVTAIPLSVLRGFGLISKRKADKARESWIFRLWSFLVAASGIAGTIFTYLSSKDAVDAKVRALLAFWSH